MNATHFQNIIVRHYQGADRASVFEIAADTAFFGEEVEAYLDDRQLFCDAFVGFYTTYKAEFGWVAEDDGEVLGYLLGSTQPVTQSSHWLNYMLAQVVIPGARRKYSIGRRTMRYALSTVMGYLHGEEPPVDLKIYPAHLHINLKKEVRGYGVGRRLIEAYLNQLVNLQIDGVYLHTTSKNEAACRLYKKMGFQILSHRPNAYWSKWFGIPVDNLSFGLKLI